MGYTKNAVKKRVPAHVAEARRNRPGKAERAAEPAPALRDAMEEAKRKKG